MISGDYVYGNNLICGVHDWDYGVDSGVSEYNNSEILHKFSTKIEDNNLFIDVFEIDTYLANHPRPFNRGEYLSPYADTYLEDTEPYMRYIKEIAEIRGLKEGDTVISPANSNFHAVDDFKVFAKAVRERAGGIPIGFKLGACYCGIKLCITSYCMFIGIVIQKESLRSRLIIDAMAKQLHNLFEVTNNFIKIVMRSCRYDDDVTKFNYNNFQLTIGTYIF